MLCLRYKHSLHQRLRLLPSRFLPAYFPFDSSARTMLDINLFREDKGNNPEIIRESLRRRFQDVGVVDEVIRFDLEWRRLQFERSELQKEFNKMNKEIAKLRISKQDASEMIKSTNENKRLTAEKDEEVKNAKTKLDEKLNTIGNLVHDTVPYDNNEDNNEVVRKFREEERRMEPNLKNHVELVERLGIADLKKGIAETE